MGTAKEKKRAAAAELRRRAEERLREKPVDFAIPRTEEATLRLVQEFEIRQIELEMQNEELHQIQTELERSRDSYLELYDFAPVAYLTFDAAGIVRKTNFIGAQLLGIDRAALIGQPLSSFMAEPEANKIFSDHLAWVLQRQSLLRCEFELERPDGQRIQVQLQSIGLAAGDQAGLILSSVIDTTVRKRLEDDLQRAHDSLELTVAERTGELSVANRQLAREVEERKTAEASLREAYAEIKGLKDRLQAENIYLRLEAAREYNFGELIGQSQALAQVFLRIEQVAPMNATVLLLGETGSGKGVVARAIHSRSARKDRPMITVNCTALPANLIESELFGREKGAFTGAHARQIGRFELADGGTIFLDEIGEMPLELQVKLLRIIQDGEFERLGGPRTLKVDVRIIAASNRNLEEEIRLGRFREDLYYRLNVFPITIPPLRQRQEDIPLLVKHFVTKFNKKNGKNIDSVSKETLNLLQAYPWPGNVRELESVVERAIITSQGNRLEILDQLAGSRITASLPGDEVKALAELEHDHILQVLQKTGWRIEGKEGAARLLGLNASTLRARMRKAGIRRQ